LIVIFEEIFGIVRIKILNVKDGIWLGFHPKGVRRLDVARNVHDITFTSDYDDVWIFVVFIEGTYAIFELPGEEIIPACSPSRPARQFEPRVRA